MITIIPGKQSNTFERVKQVSLLQDVLKALRPYVLESERQLQLEDASVSYV